MNLTLLLFLNTLAQLITRLLPNLNTLTFTSKRFKSVSVALRRKKLINLVCEEKQQKNMLIYFSFVIFAATLCFPRETDVLN